MKIAETASNFAQWWPVRALRAYTGFGIHVMFWGFHITIIAISLFGVLPEVAWPLLVDLRSGRATWEIVAPLLAWMILPFVFVTIAWKRFRSSPWSLLGIFYGIELPLLWGLVLRMFAHEFAGAAYLIIGGISVGILAALAHVVLGDRSPWWLQPLMIVLAVCGAFIAAITSMMVAPTLLVGLYDVIDELVFVGAMPSLEDILTGLTLLVPMSVSVVGAALFFFVPLFIVASLTWPFLAPVAWVLLAGAASKRVGTLKGPSLMWMSVAGSVTVAAVAIAMTWSHQPHIAALAIDDADRSPASLRGILQDEARIRAGLTHAFLGSYRTISDNTHIDLGWSEVAERYEGTLWRQRHEWTDDHTELRRAARERWASRFESVAGPFVYHGNYRHDAELASELYAQLFGEEIERSERDAINHALGTTTLRGNRNAGFMDQGAQRVHLLSQHITSEIKDGVATIEIHDEWQNQTPEDQEVLLAFSLPPTAAVDGLWLGGNANKNEAFVGKLSPRGAAQQVYREQVQRRSDPALLEQVGPFQYRLRAFPIPAEPVADRDTNWLSATRKAPHVHTWVRYQVPVGSDGVVAMPRLSERRNGFWSSHTKRTINGKETDASDDEAWVQTTVTAPAVADIRGLVDGQCWQLSRVANSGSVAGKRIDVVIDTSYDVGKNRAALMGAVEALRASGASLRWLVATTPFADRGAAPVLVPELSLDGVVFIGAASPKVMLRQYLSASKGRADAIVVLAGRSNFDVADDQPLEMSSLPPTYLVHLAEVPTGYDDATADALSMSGGTVVGAVGDALAALQPGPLVVDGRVLSSSTGCAEGPPSAVLTRLVIRDRDRSRNRSDAKTLDGLHGLARAAHVVTPYSSLIALVDAEQLKRLAELEGQDDRFQREVEVQTKMTPSSSNMPFDVSGAPEPATWALLATAAAAAAWKKRRRAS
jgi:putative PEP-CTERM system integral membrane protein